ncbi:MAG TPA: T9SS type A sorting domain-containing protein [Bacteroidia bacterium]|nr:T9SS type A sorting domain-containing protein [Bacteroidia bacterium]
MKLIIPLFAYIVLAFPAFGQKEILPQTGTVELLGIFTFPEAENSFAPSISTIYQAPKPASDYGNKKAVLDVLRKSHAPVNQGIQRKSGSAVIPQASQVFLGNNANGVPNDNDIAISDSGFIVSVLNSNMRVYNQTGTIQKNFTLAILGGIPTIQNFTFDPRVVYDPDTDRFIIVFLNGRDENSQVIVCFSKTNDPTKLWTAYKLPGANLFQDSTWSDYPIISISSEDLFITLNILKNGGGFRDGFRESVIWQVGKKEGYDGDTALKYNRWNDIKYGNRPVWSICPAQGGFRPDKGPKSYFLSVRPTDFQNDSIFVTEISNTLSSSNATRTTRLVKASRNYGFPPNAFQPQGKKNLSTNDGRVLTAMVQNGIIQFAGNCVDTNNYAAGIYHGYMDVNGATATLNIISSDTCDYGYPDIAYAGNGEPWDNSAMLTFSKSSPNYAPGTAIMYVDRNMAYSDVVSVRAGNGPVSLVSDSIERWGDYTGIQRKYNEDRTFWLSGSVATTPAYGTVIAKITNPDPALGVSEPSAPLQTTIFPNPAKEEVHIEFDNPSAANLTFNLYDANGKLVLKLVEDKVKTGKQRFTFNTLPLAEGVYFLGILRGNQTLKYEKIVVSR